MTKNHSVKVVIASDNEEAATAVLDVVQEAAKFFDATTKEMPIQFSSQRRGIIELSQFAEWLLIGGANVTAGIIANFIFEKLNKNQSEYNVHQYERNEKRDIEIVDQNSGLKITIREEIIVRK